MAFRWLGLYGIDDRKLLGVGGVSVSTYTHGLRRHERRHNIISNNYKDGMALELDGYTGGRSENEWLGVISIYRSFGGDRFQQVTGSYHLVVGLRHCLLVAFL